MAPPPFSLAALVAVAVAATGAHAVAQNESQQPLSDKVQDARETLPAEKNAYGKTLPQKAAFFIDEYASHDCHGCDLDTPFERSSGRPLARANSEQRVNLFVIANPRGAGEGAPALGGAISQHRDAAVGGKHSVATTLPLRTPGGVVAHGGWVVGAVCAAGGMSVGGDSLPCQKL